MTDRTEIIATGDLRPERIQEPVALQIESGQPSAAIDPTIELRPERIQNSAAFRALVERRNWMYDDAEEIGADRLVGYFNAPRAEEVSALARLVLDIAPHHGSRPVFNMKAGAVTVSFGEDDAMSDVDVAFAHLFESILPKATTVFALSD